MTIEEYLKPIPYLPYDTVGAIERGDFPSVYKTAVRKHGDWKYIMCLSGIRPAGYLFTLALHNVKTDERYAITPAKCKWLDHADCIAQGKAWIRETDKLIKRGEMPPKDDFKFWLKLYL